MRFEYKRIKTKRLWELKGCSILFLRADGTFKDGAIYLDEEERRVYVRKVEYGTQETYDLDFGVDLAYLIADNAYIEDPEKEIEKPVRDNFESVCRALHPRFFTKTR